MLGVLMILWYGFNLIDFVGREAPRGYVNLASPYRFVGVAGNILFIVLALAGGVSGTLGVLAVIWWVFGLIAIAVNTDSLMVLTPGYKVSIVVCHLIGIALGFIFL